MAGRGAWVFVSVLMILGTFSFALMLGAPLFNSFMQAAYQLSPWNAELYDTIELIFQILPIACLLGGIVLYVLVESNASSDE